MPISEVRIAECGLFAQSAHRVRIESSKGRVGKLWCLDAGPLMLASEQLRQLVLGLRFPASRCHVPGQLALLLAALCTSAPLIPALHAACLSTSRPCRGPLDNDTSNLDIRIPVIAEEFGGSGQEGYHGIDNGSHGKVVGSHSKSGDGVPFMTFGGGEERTAEVDLLTPRGFPGLWTSCA